MNKAKAMSLSMPREAWVDQEFDPRLAVAWWSAVAPHMHKSPHVSACHNLVRSGVPIRDVFPGLVAALVEHAGSMQHYALRLLEMQPGPTIIISPDAAADIVDIGETS